MPAPRARVLPALLSVCLTVACTSMSPALPDPAPPKPLPALDHALQALVDDRQHPLLAVAALAIRDGRVVYANQFGSRHLGSQPGEAALPVTARTLFRVASISKLVVALGVLRLVEDGRLDLDADVSRTLGWTLRHPQFPDRPITLRLLLSHRSGLSDGGESYFFDGRTRLQDVLSPQGRLYRVGQNWQAAQAPGSGFQYVNLNFGVIATVMERATGERFDRLMQRLVLQPLGLRGGFNPADFPAADQADIATLYRKRRTEGPAGQERDIWDPTGPWVVQADDFRHQPPAPPDGLDGYEIGSNGTLFGPQGRLRISVQDLGTLMQMLLADGRHQGRPFLQPASVAMLASEQWLQDATHRNGSPSNDWARSWGLGVQRFTDHSGPGRGDRLVDGGGFTGWGHSGDAYGMLGLFVLDPARRRGMVVITAGPGVDPASFPSQWSAQSRWQEIAHSAVHRHALQVSAP